MNRFNVNTLVSVHHSQVDIVMFDMSVSEAGDCPLGRSEFSQIF
jgi:hypothetical protein